MHTNSSFKETLPMVTLHDGVPVVTSMEVAKHFEKEHYHVLRDIRRIGNESPDRRWAESNFGLSYKINELANGKSEPYYMITREGFMILGMGFTGSKAMGMKIAFVKAFTAMEQEILFLRKQEAVAPPRRPRHVIGDYNLSPAGRRLPVVQKVRLMNNATQIARAEDRMEDVKAIYADLCNTVADGSASWSETVADEAEESVLGFVEQCTTPCGRASHRAPVSKFYAAYVAWCDSTEEGYVPAAQHRFINLLRRFIPEVRITRPRRDAPGHRPLLIAGLALNDAWA